MHPLQGMTEFGKGYSEGALTRVCLDFTPGFLHSAVLAGLLVFNLTVALCCGASLIEMGDVPFFFFFEIFRYFISSTLV